MAPFNFCAQASLHQNHMSAFFSVTSFFHYNIDFLHIKTTRNNIWILASTGLD